MHRVVDAMNVIGSRPDGRWRDHAGAIEGLVGQVDRWAEHREEQMTVMLAHGARRRAGRHRLDDRDRRQRRRSRDPRRLPDCLAADEVVVVTSDHDLKAKVLAAGAEVVPSRPLRGVLTRKLTGPAAAATVAECFCWLGSRLSGVEGGGISPRFRSLSPP
jgi:hypothetical protein